GRCRENLAGESDGLLQLALDHPGDTGELAGGQTLLQWQQDERDRGDRDRQQATRDEQQQAGEDDVPERGLARHADCRVSAASGWVCEPVVPAALCALCAPCVMNCTAMSAGGPALGGAGARV
ncbi:hypothetical protein RZS08_22915, partial [Arthrospira platensis SPKY1]|nr:hypothetical protein [Arthrospira platensis SPKY1]